MEIIVPKIEDFDEINKIAKQVHEMHVKWRPDIYVSVDEVIQKDLFKELVMNKEIYVIKEKDKIIGYVTFKINEKQRHGMHDRKIINIEAIGIDKKYRNKGMGSKLINHIINIGKKQKCTDLYLSVNEENINAIKFYEKLGMKVKNISYSMKI